MTTHEKACSTCRHFERHPGPADRELVIEASEAEQRAADTSVETLTPLEAAVLTMSHDLAETLRCARQLQEQGRALETFARALAADMEAVKKAIRATALFETMTGDD